MRIVYVWDADYPWDVRTHKIAAALTRDGHEVHIVARNRRWLQRSEALPEATVHRMQPWRWAGRRADGVLGFPAFVNPRWVSLIQRVVREVNPDVLMVRDLPLCPTAIFVGRRERVPVVLDMAENYAAMMQWIFDAGRQRPADYVVRNPAAVAVVERYCLPRLDGVLVVVDEMAERLRSMGVPTNRVDVVSNTPPLSRVLSDAQVAARLAGREGDPIRVVYLGLMEIARGVLELIEALAELHRRHRGRYALTMIGAGRDLALCVARARELELPAGVISFAGYLPNEEALHLVESSDVGVVPHHRSEAWDTSIPNKLFDYMAAGLPCVTSDARPAARIIRDTGAGVVFRSRDAADLAGALERLADREERSRCGDAGRAAIRARYHWERDAGVLQEALIRVTRVVAKSDADPAA